MAHLPHAVCGNMSCGRAGARLYLVARNSDHLESVAEKCKELGSGEVTILQVCLSRPYHGSPAVPKHELCGSR